MERKVNFYFDDILVYAASVRLCIMVLDEVLDRIGKVLMAVKGLKCEILFEEMVYLGYLVILRGLLSDLRRLKLL